MPRASSALLSNTGVRLTELTFPSTRLHVVRTRLAFIHVDNLLHFAKMDRDGKVDGFVAVYLPMMLVVLLLRKGDLITSVAFREGGRAVIPLAEALTVIRAEMERGELEYADAPMEELAWIYQSCAAPALRRPVDEQAPHTLFPMLRDEKFTGILELISNGRVAYFRFDKGQYVTGFFSGMSEGMTVPQYVEKLFQPGPDGARPMIAAGVFPVSDQVPEQAMPALIQTYRELFSRLAEAAERHVPGEGMKRGFKLRDSLGATHRVLAAVGQPLDRDPVPVVATVEQLTLGLSEWAKQLLEQLEVIAPGVAVAVLKEATKEQRFVLQKAGFYQRLPWAVTW
jgi:hypothetical protein